MQWMKYLSMSGTQFIYFISFIIKEKNEMKSSVIINLLYMCANFVVSNKIDMMPQNKIELIYTTNQCITEVD